SQGYTVGQQEDGGTIPRIVFTINGDTIYSTEVATTGQWYNFIAVYDFDVSGNMYLYIDDGIGVSAVTPQKVDLDINFMFFASSYFGIGSNCKLDEIAFWDRVLTGEEMTAFFNNGNGMTYTDIPNPDPTPVVYTLDDFVIPRGTDQDERKYISGLLLGLSDRISVVSSRVDTIITFLQLDPNVLTFGVGADPTWTINNGNVPLVQLSNAGLNPPTVTGGDTIVINSAGFYDIVCQFGIDIVSGNNTVIIQPQVNAVDTGLVAGVEFSGGQAA
ncbi:unnamed protein product, partial [marine sediment metagenome]